MKIRYYIFFALVLCTAVYYFTQSTVWLIVSASISAILIFLKWLLSRRKEFKQEVILYMGETGAGKTSCAVAQAIKYHKTMDKTIRKELTPIYQQLKENGYPEVNINDIDTFIYSDIAILLNRNQISNHADFSKIGIPDSANPEVANYPLGAYFVFDEIPMKADSRDWQNFNKNVNYYFNLHRKAYHSLNLIAQDIEDVEKRIRRRVHAIRYMTDMTFFKIPFTKIYKTTWHYIEYRGPARFKNVEQGVTPNLLNTNEFVKKKKFSIWCNIFQRYDSRAELAYFLERLETFEHKPSIIFEYTKKSALEYIKEHPLYIDKPKKKKED